MQPEPEGAKPFLAEFLRIGLLSFGGPAAQIALMHQVLVEQRRWLSEQQFLGALSFCMLLPGPEAMQLATYAGWRLKGFWGGLAAGLLFVLPGAAVILTLTLIYLSFGQTALVGALFLGVKAAVLAVIIEALLRISRKALLGLAHWVLAGLAFLALFVFNLPYPLVVLAAGIWGFWRGAARTGPAETVNASITRTCLTVALGLVLWLGPLWLLDLFADTAILAAIGAFFAKLAVVTFGGAYAVLAYMAQDIVQYHGWLTAGEMMDGLGLAETTPGPLILVTQFAGHIAAAREGGTLFGLAGAAVTLWATFVPCFLWIFAGAPWIGWIASRQRLSGALQAITAAVVGVILNLSLWFALHVLFSDVSHYPAGPAAIWLPDLASLDPVALGLAVLAALLLLVLHWGIGRVLLISAVSGWVLTQLV